MRNTRLPTREMNQRPNPILRWTLSLAAVTGGAWLLAEVGHWMAARSTRWETLGAVLCATDSTTLGEAIAVAGIILLAWRAPGWGDRWFARCEHAARRMALHRRQTLFAVAVLPVAVRLALLPAIPIPVPRIPDEFGHLLLGDTFASGRLANPTHPLWRSFETLYVFHQPVYTSLYPAAQGLFLAAPRFLGASPWFGVCASIALMGAALYWMLLGWMRPQWAWLGGVLAAARFSVTTYWMNSYWGGAAAAVGGALLLGALPRLLRRPRVRDACLAGLGVAVLSQSRPLEGLLLCLPVGLVLLVRLAGTPRRNARVLATLAAAAVLIAAATLYYNYRVTGDAWRMPYQWYQRIYGMPQSLRGFAPILTAWRVSAQKDLFDNFRWQLGVFEQQSTWRGFAAALPGKLSIFWSFYLQPLLSLPLLFVPLLAARRDTRFLACTGAFVLFGGLILYPFFFQHYAAPLTGLLLILVMQGARRLRLVGRHGKPIGVALVRWWMLAALASYSLQIAGAALAPDIVEQTATPRMRIEQDLEQRGGRHLVLVHYTANHDYHEPWIYNAADIDRSPVVWARASDRASTERLLRYFAGRTVWEVNADEEEPRLTARPAP